MWLWARLLANEATQYKGFCAWQISWTLPVPGLVSDDWENLQPFFVCRLSRERVISYNILPKLRIVRLGRHFHMPTSRRRRRFLLFTKLWTTHLFLEKLSRATWKQVKHTLSLRPALIRSCMTRIRKVTDVSRGDEAILIT